MEKRLLTNDEINDILSIVKIQEGIPVETAEFIVNNFRTKIKKQLENQEIYPSMICELKNEIEKQYYTSKIQAGESVGVISAQSLGEKGTQNTLNTFHFTGQDQKIVTAGVPRFEELLNATKEPKTKNCVVYLKKKYDTIQEIRDLIGHNIVELSLEKLSISFSIDIDKKYEKWYEPFKILYNDNFTKYRDCLSIRINTDMLYEYKLTLEDIANKLEKEYEDISCVFSSDNIGILDIFIDTNKIKLPEDRILFINSDNCRYIFIEEVVQPMLYRDILFGMQGIRGIYYVNILDRFETDGTNFRELLSLPFVDGNKTISNHIWDIYSVLGIEATRQFFIEEFMNVMGGVNKCHIDILVDKMTYTGGISSISRYTMRTEESGPLSRSTFEESIDVILKAGFYGQEETTNGISASIICGKRGLIGTGICELRMDLNKIRGLGREVVENDGLY